MIPVDETSLSTADEQLKDVSAKLVVEDLFSIHGQLTTNLDSCFRDLRKRHADRWRVRFRIGRVSTHVNELRDCVEGIHSVTLLELNDKAIREPVELLGLHSCIIVQLPIRRFGVVNLEVLLNASKVVAMGRLLLRLYWYTHEPAIWTKVDLQVSRLRPAISSDEEP